MFLAGVFLDDSAPTAGTEPDRLDFIPANPDDQGNNFTDLSPALRQSFFVGDGHTDSGGVQTFHIPDGATRLYLGVEDAWDFGSAGSSGAPGFFNDNSGAFSVTPQISTPT